MPFCDADVNCNINSYATVHIFAVSVWFGNLVVVKAQMYIDILNTFLSLDLNPIIQNIVELGSEKNWYMTRIYPSNLICPILFNKFGTSSMWNINYDY